MQRRRFIQAAGACRWRRWRRAAAGRSRAICRREGAVRSGAQGRDVRLFRYRTGMGQLEGVVPRIQATLSGHRADLQRRSAATVVALERCGDARRPTPPITAASAVDAGAQGPGGAFPPRGLRAAARGVPRGRRPLVHGAHAEHRFPGQPQARRPCSRGVGRPAQARIPERGDLSRSAQHRRGPGADFAAAYGNGGDEDNVKAGTDYLGRLHAAGNVQRVEGTTPYAKFLKGEIPVWIGYENDGLKARHADGMGRRLRNRDPQ